MAKKIIKLILKLSLCTIVYAIVFILASAVLPFSQGFRGLKAPDNQWSMLLLMLNAAWVCFSVYYIIRHSRLKGTKLFLNALLVVFGVQSFMMQIETIYFAYAFPALTRLDFFLIMLQGLPPLLAIVPISVKFFQNKNPDAGLPELYGTEHVKNILIKLGIIGVVYTCVYMTFGYFVAWQFEELRIFYSGLPKKLSFAGQLANNMKNDPMIYPFQILRGILFGAFILPLKFTMANRKTFRISVCLVYLCTAMLLIIPNPLFPDAVRIAHLIEMSSSMLLLGIIVGAIL